MVAESEGSVVHSLLLLALDGELHHERSQGRQAQGHQLGSLDGGGLDSRETPSPDSAQDRTHNTQAEDGAKLDSS